jgi:beta-lactamase regulating signal transducer with metallopeptidase domain
MNPALNSTLVPALLEAAVRALAGALAVYAGLRIFRVSNVLAQKAAWGFVLAASLLMPLMMRWQGLPASVAIKLPVPAWRHTPESLPVVAPRSTSALTSVSSSEPAPQFSDTPNSMAGTGDRFPAPSISISKFNPQPSDPQIPAPYPQVNSAPRSIVHSLEPSTLAGLLYLAVCAALLLRMIYGLGKALKIWKTAKPIFPEARRQFAHDMCLRASEFVSSPVTIGSGVVLPADYIEWDAEKLRIVLAHESSHIRQGDFYLQLLAGVYAAVFWFSPLGWWLKHKLSELGEAISDRAGLEEAASSASYAQILLEFAALPRPTLIGVAMARNSNLSHRIERLLNESSFRQAFAGSRRMMLAVLLVPVALFAATALVRVEAAQSDASAPLMNSPQLMSPAAAQQSADASRTGQSKPDQSQDEASPTEESPVVPPPLPAVPANLAPSSADVMPEIAPTPPLPTNPPNADNYGDVVRIHKTVIDNIHKVVIDNALIAQSDAGRNGYSYHWSSNGDSWALVTDRSEHVRFSGDWHDGTKDMIEKVRSQGHEKFLLFTRDGKSYFLDDPAVVAQIEAMYKPMEELGRQQEELGKQQEALGKQQEELGRKQETVTIPAPDMSKEMAELKATLAAAMAKIDAENADAISQKELSDLQGKMGAIQGRLGEIEGKIGAERGKFGEMQGKLGEQQGKLGAEQGRLGAEQGRIGAEANQKVKGIIDESLSNGKARPVQ